MALNPIVFTEKVVRSFATMKAGERRILPIWHELSADEVKKYSPMLSDLLAANSAEGVSAIVAKICAVCRNSG
jgi:hypothetical protein